MRHVARETAAHADQIKLTGQLQVRRQLEASQANLRCKAHDKDQALEMDLFENRVSAKYDNAKMVINQWIWGRPTFRQPI